MTSDDRHWSTAPGHGPDHEPTTSRRRRRYLVAGVAAAALIGGGAYAADAATSASTPSAAASGSASSSTAPKPPTPKVHKPHIDGSVTAVGGDTVTVKDRDGFTREIKLSSSTKYTAAGKTSSRSALVKGKFVHAEGTVDSNGTSLDATTIEIMSSAPTPGHGPGHNGTGRPAPPNGGSQPS